MLPKVRTELASGWVVVAPVGGHWLAGLGFTAIERILRRGGRGWSAAAEATSYNWDGELDVSTGEEESRTSL
jgi:hypothetical protein